MPFKGCLTDLEDFGGCACEESKVCDQGAVGQAR